MEKEEKIKKEEKTHYNAGVVLEELYYRTIRVTYSVIDDIPPKIEVTAIIDERDGLFSSKLGVSFWGGRFDRSWGYTDGCIKNRSTILPTEPSFSEAMRKAREYVKSQIAILEPFLERRETWRNS